MHWEEQQEVDEGDRVPFPGLPESVTAELQRLRELDTSQSEKLRFYQGQVIIFPWAQHLLDTSDEADVKVVMGTDCCHCWGLGLGTLYHLVLCDANRSTVPLAFGHFAMNEGVVTWKVFIEFAAAKLPLLGQLGDRATIYRDGAAAISHALSAHLPDVRRFYCSDHASKAIGKVFPGGLGAYNRMAHARTANALRGARRQAPPAMLTWLADASKNPFPDEERFLADFMAAGGSTQATLNTRDSSKSKTQYVSVRSTDQMAEVNMWSSKASRARGMDPTNMLIQIYETAVKHMVDNKAAADSCDIEAPPQVQKMMALHVETAKSAHCHVEFTSSDQSMAKVRAHTDRAAGALPAHTVNLKEGTCSCGLTALTGFPCEDLVAAARASRGFRPSSYLQAEDLTPFWKKQYDFDFASTALSTAEVWAGATTELRMPLLLPRGAGRPKVERHKSWTDGFGLAGARKVRRMGAPDPKPKKPKNLKPKITKPKGAYCCRKCGMPKKGHMCMAV